MRPAIRKRVIKSGLLWIAIGAVAAALGCASSSEFADGEGDDAASGSRSSLSGEEVGGSDFERYGVAMAVSLAYGVLIATLITLFLVPCMYLILNDGHKLVARLKGQ